jgi:hypothetical protein
LIDPVVLLELVPEPDELLVVEPEPDVVVPEEL